MTEENKPNKPNQPISPTEDERKKHKEFLNSNLLKVTELYNDFNFELSKLGFSVLPILDNKEIGIVPRVSFKGISLEAFKAIQEKLQKGICQEQKQTPQA